MSEMSRSPLPSLAGELRSQPQSNVYSSLPPSLFDSGPEVPCVAGAPNTLWAPEVSGFHRMVGQAVVLTGAYPCEGSLR